MFLTKLDKKGQPLKKNDLDMIKPMYAQQTSFDKKFWHHVRATNAKERVIADIFVLVWADYSLIGGKQLNHLHTIQQWGECN